MKSVLRSALILTAALGALGCKREAEVAAPSLKDAPQPRELVLIRDEPYMEKPYVRTIDVSGWKEGEDAVIIYGEHTIIPYPWNGEDTIMYSYTNDHLLVRVDPQDTTVYLYWGYYGDYRLQKNYLADTTDHQGTFYFQGKVVGLGTSRIEKLKIETPEDIVCIGDFYRVNLDSLKQYPNLTAVGISYGSTCLPINFWNLVYRYKFYRSLRKIPDDIDLYLSYTYMLNPDSRKLARLKNLKGLDACAYPLADRTFERIGKMKNLRQLELWYTSTKDDELRHLVNLKNLHTLTLKYVKITDQGLAHLAKIRSLRSLRLEDFQPHTYWDYLHWFENQTAFSWSSGEYSERFDYIRFIEELPYQYGSLFVPHTTAEGWRHLAELPYLRELDLGQYGLDLRNEDLEGIGSIAGLRRLELQGQSITDEGLRYLEGLKNLKELAIYSKSITWEGINRLQQALPGCKIDHTLLYQVIDDN
jgi:hypothetical protein